MEESTHILECKCPFCNTGLIFNGREQKMRCAYCDNIFDTDTVQSYMEFIF